MSPNQAQHQAWNGGESVHYVDHADRYDRQLAPVTDALLARADVTPRDTVLDVGCGCGALTLAAARSARRALGLDISEPLVEIAAHRARSAGLTNAEFVVADAQTHPFPRAAYDIVLAQFGLMFFDDPVGAFRNLRAALIPGGRIVFTTWRALEANAWLAPVSRAVALFDEVPDLGGIRNGPGMFALKDGEEVAALLDAAGFVGIAVESISPTLLVGGGGSIDETVGFLLGMGIVRGLLGRLSEADRQAATTRVRSELAQHHQAGVGVQLAAGAWLVSASTEDGHDL